MEFTIRKNQIFSTISLKLTLIFLFRKFFRWRIMEPKVMGRSHLKSITSFIFFFKLSLTMNNNRVPAGIFTDFHWLLTWLEVIRGVSVVTQGSIGREAPMYLPWGLGLWNVKCPGRFNSSMAIKGLNNI